MYHAYMNTYRDQKIRAAEWIQEFPSRPHTQNEEEKPHVPTENDGPPAKRLRVEPVIDDVCNPEEYTEAIHDLQEECKKPKKDWSQPQIKELMENTFSGRRNGSWKIVRLLGMLHKLFHH